jgi:NADH-quinone oxidoreductase subunit L
MGDNSRLLLVMVPALPLLAAILVGVLGARLLRGYSHWIVILSLAASFACSFQLLLDVRDTQQRGDVPATGGFEEIVTLWTWSAVSEAYELALTPASDSATSIVEGGLRDFRIGVTLRADALTCVMLSMVTFVSALVAIFAAGYMHGDRGYWRFFAYFALFVFSMTMLVSVSNFLLLFVFWEAVGVCSYLLIGFWYQKPAAAAAGQKAFLVNRVGDFGFTLAIFLIWATYGTLNFHDTLWDGTSDAAAVSQAMDARLSGQPAEEGREVVRGVLGRWRISANDYTGGGLAFAICGLLLVGACGKSAQFPLHVWLPDAMEGPTPVSALIHAATMVTAGVYMIARCTPLFMASPAAQLLVATIGATTALLAALIALTQFDLKRVLAYSTVSQLGFMFMGLGAGTFAGITSGMFHLFTHAFFKALLFLGAGSVMHAMGNVIDMRRFGGLRRIMPTTHATFLVGCLALAGFPFLAGFFSKDAIVAAIHDRAHELHHAVAAGDDEHASTGAAGQATGRAVQMARYATAYDWIYFVAMFTAFLTAFYTFRAFYMTFYGPLRVPREAGSHAHESPRSMAVPLIVLAVFAAVLGFGLDQTWRTVPNHVFASFLGYAPSLAGGAVAATRHPFEFHLTVAATSGVIAVAGILLATYLYLGRSTEIAWLRAMFAFEGFSKAMDGQALARMGGWKWVRLIHIGATRVGLGWLTAALSQLLILILTVLATPLLLGNFITPYKLSFEKFYLDEIYHFVLVLPLRFLAWICYAFDRWVVDGFVNLLGRLPLSFGSLMRSLQTGLIHFYALAMVLGSLVLLAARFLWAG